MARNLSTVSLIQSSNDTSTKHSSSAPLAAFQADTTPGLTSDPQFLLRLARIKGKHLPIRFLSLVPLCQPLLQVRVPSADRIHDGLVGERSVADEVSFVLALDGGFEVCFGYVPHVGKLDFPHKHRPDPSVLTSQSSTRRKKGTVDSQRGKRSRGPPCSSSHPSSSTHRPPPSSYSTPPNCPRDAKAVQRPSEGKWC